MVQTQKTVDRAEEPSHAENIISVKEHNSLSKVFMILFICYCLSVMSGAVALPVSRVSYIASMD